MCKRKFKYNKMPSTWLLFSWLPCKIHQFHETPSDSFSSFCRWYSQDYNVAYFSIIKFSSYAFHYICSVFIWYGLYRSKFLASLALSFSLSFVHSRLFDSNMKVNIFLNTIYMNVSLSHSSNQNCRIQKKQQQRSANNYNHILMTRCKQFLVLWWC